MKSQESVCERIKTCASLEPEQVLESMQCPASGWTMEEAVRQRILYGSNTPFVKERDSIWFCILRAFANPFSLTLFFLGILTMATDSLGALSGSRHFSAIIIFSMLVCAGIIRLIQELQARKIAANLTRRVNTTVKTLRQGQWRELEASQLVVGDQILLEAGDRVPADLRLIEAADLFVLQSVITGESAVLEKTARPLAKEPDRLGEYANMLFAGTTLMGGQGKGVVLAVGNQTVYGALDAGKPAGKQGFNLGAHSIARVLLRFMTVLVPIVFLACGLTKANWLEAFLFALSVAVGLTPELLPMVVNACLAKGSYAMSQKKTIVKNINAMQGFGSMDVLCVDKTGTLTGDEVQLEYYMDILGNECQKTLDYAYLASRYSTGVGSHLDQAICRVETIPAFQTHYEQLRQAHPKVDEQPFDYDRRFSRVLVRDGEKQILILKGSLDEVSARCAWTEYGGKIFPIAEDPASSVHAITDEMLEEGMKVIAVAYKPLEQEVLEDRCGRDFILLGYLTFFDAPKQSAASAIAKLQRLQVDIKVLSGDQKLVTSSICRRLQIPADHILSGRQLEGIAGRELSECIEKTQVFCELTPKQKAMVVEHLQSRGHTVGFLGDGMNDLPGMLQADVGISVENAVDTLKESASVILLKKDLNVLEEGILEGRKAFANMAKYIKITASSNFGNICAIVVASVCLPFFPMTSVQLLLLNLLYDILCLVLPWDEVDWEMLEVPLEWSGKNLGKFMTFFGPISSIFDLVTFAFLFFVLCPYICGGSFGQLDYAMQIRFISLFQTGWFLESMWSQVLILQLLRTPRLPFLQSRPGRLVVLITGLGIVLFTCLPGTPLGSWLGLQAMPFSYYIFLIGVVALYLLLVTMAKSYYLRRTRTLI